MENISEFVAEQWILFVGLFLIIGLLIRSWLEPRLSGVKQLNVQEAVRLINQDNSVVLDIRLEKEYVQGHIRDAIHIPLGTLDSRVSEINKHKSNPILVSCQNGQRVQQANRLLKKRGFTDLHNLAGGVNAWLNANLPITKQK